MCDVRDSEYLTFIVEVKT